MKLLFDFLPILLFFVAFRVADGHADAAARFASDHFGFMVSGGVVGPGEAPVLLATLVVVVATVVQIAIFLAMRRKIHAMLWVAFALVTVLGGLTVWFHNPTFIKWKPSALDWAMCIVLWGSQTLFHKNLLKSLVGEQIELPERIWQRLNVAWIAFFALMGLANLYVAYNYSTSTWATFKVFGLTGFIFLFTLAQGFAVARYVKIADEAPPPGDVPSTAQGESA
jgi:intracellular septation protein